HEIVIGIEIHGPAVVLFYADVFHDLQSRLLPGAFHSPGTMERKDQRPAGLYEVLYIGVAHDRRLLAQLPGVSANGRLELKIYERLAPDFANAFADHRHTVECVQYRSLEELAGQRYVRIRPLGGGNVDTNIYQPVLVCKGRNRRTDGRIALGKVELVHRPPSHRHQDGDIIRYPGSLKLRLVKRQQRTDSNQEGNDSHNTFTI